MINMLDCCEDARLHHMTVFEKYKDNRYKRAAVYVEIQLARGFRLPELRFNPILACSSPASYHRRRDLTGRSSLPSYVTTAITSTSSTATTTPFITDVSDDGRQETVVSL